MNVCIAAAVGGGILGGAKVLRYQSGALGFFGFMSFVKDGEPMSNVIWAVIAVAVAMVLAFVMTIATYTDDEPKAKKTTLAKKASVDEDAPKSVFAPVKGEVIPLDQVDDQAFASGVMGKGMAIIPTEGKVCSPCDGVVSAIFPTGHAVGVTSNDGVEVLIHIGMDTVKMEGRGFDKKVKEGDKVTRGQILVEFDMDAVQKAGYSLVTPVIITNTNQFADIVTSASGTVDVADELLVVM